MFGVQSIYTGFPLQRVKEIVRNWLLWHSLQQNFFNVEVIDVLVVTELVVSRIQCKLKWDILPETKTFLSACNRRCVSGVSILVPVILHVCGLHNISLPSVFCMDHVWSCLYEHSSWSLSNSLKTKMWSRTHRSKSSWKQVCQFSLTKNYFLFSASWHGEKMLMFRDDKLISLAVIARETPTIISKQLTM